MTTVIHRRESDIATRPVVLFYSMSIYKYFKLSIHCMFDGMLEHSDIEYKIISTRKAVQHIINSPIRAPPAFSHCTPLVPKHFWPYLSQKWSDFHSVKINWKVKRSCLHT